MRQLSNAAIAASVVRRHLARGPRHSLGIASRLSGGRFPAPSSGPIGDLVAAGELTAALEAARSPALRSWLAGELAVLEPVSSAEGLDKLDRRWSRSAQPSPVEPVETQTVLHLVTNALPETVAGYTIRTHGIASAQAQHGLDVHVASRLGFPVTKGVLGAEQERELDGVRYHRLLAPVPLRADAARARDIELTSALVERLQPTVLHAHSNHLNAQVALAVGRRFAIPVVYEVRGFLEETWLSRRSEVEPRARANVSRPDQAETYRLARNAETWAMRYADAVVTLSESMRQAIVGRGIDPAKVHLSPNAVPDSLVEGHDKLDRRWSGRAVTVGTVGTLNHYEGLDLLLEAVARVVASGQSMRVLIVGDGPARRDLEAQAARLGVDATFTGQVSPDTVASYHQQIDVFCVPRRDLLVTRLVPPLKPLEAMALGRPVVASDLPPLREIVAHGHTGVLVAPDDVDALATAIGTLARRADSREQLGANGREFVSDHRTWTSVHHTLTDVYARLYEGVPHV